MTPIRPACSSSLLPFRPSIASSASPIGPICFSTPAARAAPRDRIIDLRGQSLELHEPLG